MHVDDYILIDQYLQGELPEARRSTFEARLREEADFAQALEEREELNRYLRAQAQLPALQEKMDALGKQYFEGADEPSAVVRPLWQKPWVVVVGIAAAITLVLLLWNPLQDTGLYGRYDAHPELALVQRSGMAENSADLQAAYNNGDYEQAYEGLKVLVDEDAQNTQAQLALGISALETDRLEEARTVFEGLAEGNTAFQEYGRWYLALSYVKAGHLDKAKTILVGFEPEDAKLKQQVEALLAE